ncbi:MAG TPA: G1 family glutamic endopeptidase [Acidimicrobiales bacterium]|jgi:hypothetical protein|nr:G1 family glutamic endopeptidase [Acidimicrobiales bacterium]
MRRSGMRARSLAGTKAVLLALGGLLLGGSLAPALPAVRLLVPPGHRGHAPALTFPLAYGGNYYGWTSSNWSGYAVTPATGPAGPYTSVSASWTVPTLVPSRRATYSAAWVGIDGFDNGELIQTGTEQDYYRGAQHDAVWWTTNEAGFAEQPFTTLSCSACSFTVSPGDRVQASIVETSADTWTVTVADLTTGVSGTATGISHVGAGASAEWIVEDPALSVNGRTSRLAPLADYGTTSFDDALVNGGPPGLVAGAAASDAGLMVQHGRVVSTPSSPDANADGFAIAYGPTPPPPPGT